MIVYDAKLGWKLKPYWSGKHHHYDYDVEYNINSDGFRGTDAAVKEGGISIVGDSFSFGLGVNDDETFTSLLNVMHHNKFYNYSVPGYSTDQQLLLVKRHTDKSVNMSCWLFIWGMISSIICVAILCRQIMENHFSS